MFPRKSWARKAAHVFVCFLIFVCIYNFPASADNSLVGSWKFVSDSDGGTADNGVTVTLSFNLSGVAFSAVGPGQNISGQGSYSTSASNITINLSSIGKSANNQPFSINVNTLTLPFKVFSDGPGTSTWSRVMTPGGNNSNPPQPPSPPTPPNNPNNPPGNDDSSHDPGPKQPKPVTGQNTQNPPKPPTPEDSKFAAYVGDWVGDGWSWETRFRQSRKDFTNQLFHGIPDEMADRSNVEGNVMEVMVQHETKFQFTVDEKGHIEGRGSIVYNVSPNLCGLAVLTKQVNETINKMKDMAAVYRQANEIGTGVLHTFNKDWLEKENELADGLKELANEDSEILAESEHAAEASVKTEEDIEKDVEKALEEIESKSDTGKLAAKAALERCSSTSDYEVLGGLPCSLITSPAVETELKSGIKAFGKVAGEKTEDGFWEGVIEPGKELMKELNGVEKKADTACLSTSVTNADELYDLVKEKFNEVYRKEAKGAALGGASASIGNLADGTKIAKGVTAMDNTTEMAEGLDPNEMVNLMLSIPGVTQVAYQYKALPNGPETRLFRMSGYLEPSSSGGAPNMHLTMNTDDAWGGKKNLEVDYMVNFKWTQGFFPIWSPFPNKPAQTKLSGTVTLPKQTWGDGKGEGEGEEGAPEPPTQMTVHSPFAMYHDTGKHRNGVVPWQEYEYFWFAYKVTGPKGANSQQAKSTQKSAKE